MNGVSVSECNGVSAYATLFYTSTPLHGYTLVDDCANS
jgi:hypothetical protein